MVFLVLFLSLLLAALLVQLLREFLRRKELSSALVQAQDERMDIDIFLNGLFVEMRRGSGLAGAMTLAAHYLAEQSGAKAAAVYDFQDNLLTAIGVWGPYPLYNSCSRMLLNNPTHLYEQLHKEHLPLGHGFIGGAAAGSGPERVAEPAADERFKNYLPENLKGGVLAMPLKTQEKLIGAVCVFRRSAGSFSAAGNANGNGTGNREGVFGNQYA